MLRVTQKLHRCVTTVKIAMCLCGVAVLQSADGASSIRQERGTRVQQTQATALGGKGSDDVGEHGTPQQLLLAFLGALVLDHDNRGHLSAGVFIDVLGYLDISETATRATLNRMVRTGLLDRQQTGRIASFGMTARAEELLHQGRERVVSEQPFTPSSDEWTLLSYSVPESQRDLRHQLRSKLLWAGFGRIRDGLWIAPGDVDVREVLADTDTPDAVTVAFAGRPTAGTSPDDFVRSAWDLDQIESEHQRFIEVWENPASGPANPVAAYTAFGADWLRLLRADPGLPAHCLPVDWPAGRSVALHTEVVRILASDAEDMLDHMIMSRSSRK